MKMAKKLNKILGKNSFFSLNLILNEWSAVKDERARPRGCYITRCYTRDWAFKAIAQSQNVINKNVIFTWNGWVNCGIDCWFCCKSLFWLNILSKLILFLFVCFVLFCSVLSSFFSNVRFTLLFSNFIFWEVCSCEVRFFVLSSTNPEFHEHEMEERALYHR